MSAAVVRDAVEADTEAIVELTASGWRVAYTGIVPAERIENLPITQWRHDVSSGLRAPVADSFTRVAEIDGEVVGLLLRGGTRPRRARRIERR